MRYCPLIWSSLEEIEAPSEEEQEKADRSPWLMLAPRAVLLVLAIAASPALPDFFERAASQIVQRPASMPSTHGAVSR
jgi:hypothetical protein